MKVILTTNGREVLVDDDVVLPRPPFIVARRYAAFSTGGRSNYMMVHHYVWGKNVYLDHINGNPLDNRRENLRESRPSENSHNQPARNSLGLKGVYRYGRNGKFKVMISKDRTNFHVGVFSDPMEAARAYDRKARELYGPHARTNFHD